MSEPTRAQLQERISTLTEERDRWKEWSPNDPEAIAIGTCAKALDKLRKDTPSPSRTSYTYSTEPRSTSTPVERVLQYLSVRFGGGA